MHGGLAAQGLKLRHRHHCAESHLARMPAHLAKKRASGDPPLR